MVKPKDVKLAKRHAQELGITDLGMQPLVLAMVVKAAQLAAALGISRAEAWSALHAERKALMDYVHQKQAPKADGAKAPPPATAYLIPEGEARPVMDAPDAFDQDTENLDFSPIDQ